jgi:ABC-type phosphate transport system ATPase subunit
MNKLLPILLVVVLSGCGKSPYEKCVDRMSTDNTDYRSVMERMTQEQKNILNRKLQRDYYNVQKRCKAIHK